MTKVSRFLTLTGLTAAVLLPAYAQQPPDSVVSDASLNTAMGTGALSVLDVPDGGASNTASGANALHFNTVGFQNVADGTNALYSNTQGTGNVAVGVNALQNNVWGDQNTAIGIDALFTSVSGQSNTAVGSLTMYGNSTGSWNSAYGASALSSNTIGSFNTGLGSAALGANTTGNYNTAVGGWALRDNTTGNYNTAVGYNALLYSTTGIDNSALGYEALYSNTGTSNTAVGYKAVYTNTTGIGNLGSGAFALYANTTGSYNVGEGDEALLHNSDGASNTAIGRNALFANTTGSENIALGEGAGYALTTGNNNIDIGNQGVDGESATIRIGAPGTQTATYIAGISTTHVTGSTVIVTSSGQLGVLASSERYKTAIASLGSDSEKVFDLRPVTFKLKSEPHGAKQYGLIAEEVDKVYPDLVIRDQEGAVQGIRYDELAPILLKVVQQQKRSLGQEEKLVTEQGRQLHDLQQQFDQFRRQYLVHETESCGPRAVLGGPQPIPGARYLPAVDTPGADSIFSPR